MLVTLLHRCLGLLLKANTFLYFIYIYIIIFFLFIYLFINLFIFFFNIGHHKIKLRK